VRSIEVLNSTSQPKVQQTTKSLKEKTKIKETNEKSTFHHFLESMSPDSQKVSESQQQGESLKKLDETLKELQEKPKETLTTEEIGILAALLPILTQQIDKSNVERQEKEQLTALVEQMEQEINAITSFPTKGFEDQKSFMGVTEKILMEIPPNDSGELLKQIYSMLQQLEKKSHGEEILQENESINKIMQELNSLTKNQTTNEQISDLKIVQA